MQINKNKRTRESMDMNGIHQNQIYNNIELNTNYDNQNNYNNNNFYNNSSINLPEQPSSSRIFTESNTLIDIDINDYIPNNNNDYSPNIEQLQIRKKQKQIHENDTQINHSP